MPSSLLKLIRWPNLLIVFITQWLVWNELIGKSLAVHNLNSNLSFFQFLLLSLSTVLVAAAGYVINDIEDIKIDLINKPDKVIVGKYILTKQCKIIYHSLLAIGFLFAVYLAWQLDEIPYLFIYPLSAACLHFYATHFKKSTLWGNLIISLFVAAVPLIIFLADIEQFSYTTDTRLYHILYLYASLAFLANLAREIVKDMQDIKGDKIFGANTFPIRFGLVPSKYLIYLLLIIIFLILLYWTWILDNAQQTKISIAFGSIPLLVIVSALIVTLQSMNSKEEFGKWSLGIKLFLLFGLLFLYLQPL